MAGITGAPAAPSPAPDLAGRPERRPAVMRPAHVRALLWLAWKLRLRGYTRSWRNVVGLVFTLLFAILPIAVGVGVATAFGYTLLDPPSATQLLFGVLLVLYVAWAALPLLQYTVNEGLDVTKLQAYPVTRIEQMLALVLATLFDLSGLVIFAAFAAVVVGWHATPLAAAITLVALALAYVHIVTLSQLLLAALMGLLRSRRYRDLSIIIFALAGVLCSLAGQIVPRMLVFNGSDSGSINFSLADLGLDKYVWWTPPGMAATAIARAGAGDYLAAALNLVVLAALVPAFLYVWGRVLDRGITTAESGGAGGSRRAARRAARVAGAGPVAAAGAGRAAIAPAIAPAERRGPLPAPALAIAGKDLRYFWRDPQLKASLFSSLLLLVLIFLPSFTSRSRGLTSGGSFFTPEQVFLAPLPALLITLSFSLNAFGYERAGAQTLFLFPVRPLHIFWGKNLAVGAIAGTAGLLATLGVAWLADGWGNVPIAIAAGLAAMLVLMGVGNVTSVLLPFRTRQMRMGENRISSDNGFLRALLQLLALGVAAALLTPVIAAIAVPLLLDQPIWLFLALPAAVAYGALVHQAATRLIAPQFHRRAPEILAVIARET